MNCVERDVRQDLLNLFDEHGIPDALRSVLQERNRSFKYPLLVRHIWQHATAKDVGESRGHSGGIRPSNAPPRYMFMIAVVPELARHDHGSQYISDYLQDELKFLGITSSPAFVREPEGNGGAERFIRTLKEQLLWVRTFDTVEELRVALLEFKERYNGGWLCERHGHQTPAQVRARLVERAA